MCYEINAQYSNVERWALTEVIGHKDSALVDGLTRVPQEWVRSQGWMG